MIDPTVYGPLITRLALRGSKPIDMEEVRTALEKICTASASDMIFTRRHFARDNVGAEAWFVQRHGGTRDGSMLTIEFGPTANQPAVVPYDNKWPELWLIVREQEPEDSFHHRTDFDLFSSTESAKAASKFVNALAIRLREALPQWATDTNDARRARAVRSTGANDSPE
jgi:hypothetical protein